MPTTRRRTPRTGGRFRITTQVVEAFTAGDSAELARLLGLKPWEPSPLETDTPALPEQDGTAYCQAWPEIYRLRQQLEQDDSSEPPA